MRFATILTLIILLLDLSLNGQTRTITGRVVSQDLESLPDVNIQNGDKLLLAKTDLEGRFKISIQQETDKLIFSWIGMESTEIKLHDKCDTVEVVMMYDGTYDFMTLKKVDRLRKERFDNLSNLYSEAVKQGFFQNSSICYERIFKEYNPPKPIRDSINKVYKLKRLQIKDTFKGLVLGDTIRVPYYGTSRYDGTDTINLKSIFICF